MNTVLRRMGSWMVAVGLTVGIVAAVPAPADAKLWKVPAVNEDVKPSVDLGEYENRMINRINVIRANKGKRELRYYQSCADGMSERWSKHLKAIDSLVHRDQYYVLEECNFTWTGEVLVSGTSLTPYQAVRAWMHSPGHRAVIMKNRATRAGAGVRVNEAGTVFAVLNFGDHD